MSSIDGIASCLSNIRSSSEGKVNKSILAQKIKKQRKYFSRKQGLDVCNQQN
jgi:hypothetical protein